MAYSSFIYMKNGNIYSTPPQESAITTEVVYPIVITGSKRGKSNAIIIKDEFFDEELRRIDPIGASINSGEIDEVHSISVFGHTKKSVSSIIQLIGIGMSYACNYTPIENIDEEDKGEEN